MGRRGPLPSKKDEHGRAIRGTVAVAYQGGSAEPAQLPVGPAPRPPTGLHREARRAWEDFWLSRAATWVDRRAHMARLIRWAHDLDQYHRVLDDMERGHVDDKGKPVVPGVVDPQRPWLGKGSRSQITVHPNAELLNQLEQRLHRAEVEFGMTPYSAVRLAGAGVQGMLTAESLNRLLAEREAAAPPADQTSEPWAAGLAPAR